jgi:quercetin dioxygenase-like cupin family protein
MDASPMNNSEQPPVRHTYVADLMTVQVVPDKGTLSRTVQNDEHSKVVLFGFAAGEELSEHTASMAAVMHFLAGEARVVVGGDALDARAGTWIHMPPHTPHSIRAKTKLVMLLLLIKGAARPRA